MQLSSGAPYWLLVNGLADGADAPAAPPRRSHVAVIGAGITGALVADALSAAGFAVTVFDHRAPAEGSTAVCTGLITYELDVELAALSAQIGTARAARSYVAAARSIDQLTALVSTLPDACGFRRRPSLYLARRRRDAQRFPREAELRAAHGLDIAMHSADDVAHRYGFRSHGALRTECAAHVDPVRLTRVLLRRATSMGAVVCARTSVVRWTSDARGAELETSRGPSAADWVVFATGYETPKELRGDLATLHSTYALVTYPIDTGGAPVWTDDCIVWDTGSPYSYARTDTHGRVMIGGEDVPFRDPLRRDRLLPDRTRRLERRLRALAPSIESRTEFSWAGTFGVTRDGLPFIGAQTGLPRALFALGYGGNGIVFGMIASRIVRDTILGEGHEDAELFALDRPHA